MNHETITRKSSALDYPLSSHFLTRASYDESYIRTCMDVNGIFDPYERDVGPKLLMTGRGKKGDIVTKTIEYNGEAYEVHFIRYYFTTSINHGLSRVQDSLPANMTIGIRFHRADANCGLLKIAETINAKKVTDKSIHKIPYEYKESVIPINNPMLNAFYAYSKGSPQYFLGQCISTILKDLDDPCCQS